MQSEWKYTKAPSDYGLMLAAIVGGMSHLMFRDNGPTAKTIAHNAVALADAVIKEVAKEAAADD